MRHGSPSETMPAEGRNLSADPNGAGTEIKE
jgi:hypothetical protein